MGKRNFGRIKSLLHFDYPYFNEPGDGLGDEVGYESWSGGEDFQLGGVNRPYAVFQSPYFGYRCAYFGGNSDSYRISGTNYSGIFNLSPLGSYEAECFIQLKDSIGGDIFTFGDLRLSISEYHLLLDCGIWNLHEEYNAYAADYEAELQEGEELDETKPYIWGTDDWYHHILLRNDKGHISVYLDGLQAISATIHNSKDTIRPDVVYLGAYYGAMDEFVFRRPAEKRNPIVPEKPYKGVLDARKISGGFGTGADGDVVISTDKTINNSYIVSSIKSSDQFVVSTTPSALSEGDEVMILLYYGPTQHVGKYVFRNVKSVDTSTKTIILDKEISVENGEDFTLSELTCSGTSWSTTKYYIRCIRIPNYNSLTIDTGKAINATSGIVAFRCKGDCTVNGSIISMGKSGHARGDLFQMTHSKLADRFLTAAGGGIFITCGGTFTAPDAARIGATWPGTNSSSNNTGAGAGLGGMGSPSAVDKDSTWRAYGGYGGVGGGGGGGRFTTISSSVTENEYGYHVGNYAKRGNTTVGGAGGGGCGGNGADIPTTGYNCIPAGAGGGGQGGSGGKGGVNNGTKTNVGYSGTVSGNKGNINGGSSNSKTSNSTSIYRNYYGGAGGGGAGGSGGNGLVQYMSSNAIYVSSTTIFGGAAGSCLFLITKKLNIESRNVISTGGKVGATPETTSTVYNMTGGSTTKEGNIYNFGGAGGGGTGFCYIACEEMI